MLYLAPLVNKHTRALYQMMSPTINVHNLYHYSSTLSYYNGVTKLAVQDLALRLSFYVLPGNC